MLSYFPLGQTATLYPVSTVPHFRIFCVSTQDDQNEISPEIHLDQFKLSAAIKYFSDCSISEWAVSKRRIQPTLSGYLGRTLLSFIVRK